MFRIFLSLYLFGIITGQMDIWTKGDVKTYLRLSGRYEGLEDIHLEECCHRCSSQLGCRHFFYGIDKKCYINSVHFSPISTDLENTTRYDTDPTKCPAIYRYKYGMCFYIMDKPMYKSNWVRARDYCHAYRGDLMVIDSQFKHDVIVPYLNAENHYSFGIYNIDLDGHFLTVDGRTDADFTYRNWNPAGLSNITDGIGVIKTFQSQFTFVWNNGQLFARYFICQS